MFSPLGKLRYHTLRFLHARLCGRLTVTPMAGVERIGTSYGGWRFPAHLVHRDMVCYFIGAGEDISFDVGVARQFGCQVRIFDPTPAAQRHFADLTAAVQQGQSCRIIEERRRQAQETDLFYDVDPGVLQRLHFHPVGVWSEDRTMKFYSPQNPAYVSHSAVNLQKTEKFFEAPCYRLTTLMAMLGDSRIDFLKMDVEGAEYAVLADMLAADIEPGLLLVEFDEFHHPQDWRYLGRIRRQVEELQQRGYLLVEIESWNFTFVHSRLLASVGGG